MIFNTLKEKYLKTKYIKKVKEIIMNTIKENYSKYKIKEKEINKRNVYKYVIRLIGINKYFPDLKEEYYFVLIVQKKEDKFVHKLEIFRNFNDLLKTNISEEEKENLIKHFTVE